MKKIITFGTFDLLHEGHIKILERARNKGDYLIVGVSTDALNAKKGKSSIFSQDQRRAYVQALEVVDEVFFEESLELKNEYINRYGANLLVMGDDWRGKFDWVSCDVEYLERTPGVSSTSLKESILGKKNPLRVLFGDTYVKKHYDCAMSMLRDMMDRDIVPILTQNKFLPKDLKVDCIVYFNLPTEPPPAEYNDVPRVCIDHGASNLKWFLASKKRFLFFDRIITAGPDHAKSLITLFPESAGYSKVHSAGFIKSNDLLAPARKTRDEICMELKVDPSQPIVLFLPTWYLSNNIDAQIAINEIAKIKNHVAILHPETVHLDVVSLNVAKNNNGVVTEAMKHASCIISDLSSTIFEAAALGKPVVQILMREYSDNNSVAYDFPYVAGTADLFCGGVPCRPEETRNTVLDVLNNLERYQPLMTACRTRILKGTVIDVDVASMIASELVLAGREGRSINRSAEYIDEIHAVGLQTVHRNLKYSRRALIAHAGGDYYEYHASNSREAIREAFSAAGMVEVNLVRGIDDIFLARNGFEEKYGLKKSFSDVSSEEFSKLKFSGELTTLNLNEFFSLLEKNDGIVVFDVKDTLSGYDEVVSAVYNKAKKLGVLDRVVVQAYCKRDFEVINRLGFLKSILAVWKYYYHDPLGDDSLSFVSECMDINDSIVYGISLPYSNRHMLVPSVNSDEVFPFLAFWKRIFIHGAPREVYPDIMRRNFGLFADAFGSCLEFKDAPRKFNWRHYIFLNPALVNDGIDNQISAVCHYYQWGEEEGRLTDYNLPEGFAVGKYLEKNPELRAHGVSGADTAKAHWTRIGSQGGFSF